MLRSHFQGLSFHPMSSSANGSPEPGQHGFLGRDGWDGWRAMGPVRFVSNVSALNCWTKMQGRLTPYFWSVVSSASDQSAREVAAEEHCCPTCKAAILWRLQSFSLLGFQDQPLSRAAMGRANSRNLIDCECGCWWTCPKEEVGAKSGEAAEK
jgi:hypothetical protein